jgi:molecular chaperone DnaK (HSP70)
MADPEYRLGIDLGSTRTTAAVHRRGTARPEVVGLGPHGTLPSTLAVDADGTLLVGDAAEQRAATAPGRVLRDLLRRVGDDTPLMVAGTVLRAEDAIARIVVQVVQQVAAQEKARPAAVTVTHPPSWSPLGVALLRNALRAQGLGEAATVAAPIAAASHRPEDPRRGPVAVIDLGGDVTVSLVSGPRRRALAGPPVTVPHLAGPAFDDAVLELVRRGVGPIWTGLDPADGAVRAAMAELRRRCTAAKERLAVAAAAEVVIDLPGIRTRVPVRRDAFEDLVRPALAEAVDALVAALEAAGVGVDDLDDVVLAGGSARIPLVTAVFSEALGRPVTVGPDPGVVTVLGATAIAGAGSPGRHRSPDRPPVPRQRGPALTVVPSPREPVRSVPRRRAVLAASAAAAAVGASAVLAHRAIVGTDTAPAPGASAGASVPLPQAGVSPTRAVAVAVEPADRTPARRTGGNVTARGTNSDDRSKRPGTSRARQPSVPQPASR